ncbi:FKBP-type peptidyl-prolyl cis-trans isomerase [Dyella sp.]|jgi:FKBP-type peptidyl-prolyl cis-trans isomerase|uniref:FKBP-type peptidyl-prolyl cis-trans isomerase n=1 Tax=Dyella sp. TaxID=1869338 RepID=UPI002D79EE73|nr:FKBP-type peptidyl-prolyl cis-trans isomerase [Dyella sp.]HET6433036.1 FKBP-type peptidyl-prolyl cis-trans isomerase [Dyella sp.]
MGKWAGLVAALWLTSGVVAHAQQSPAKAAAAPDKAKLSYAIGYQIGSQFADGEPAVDLATVQRAMADAFAKRQPDVSMAEMRAQFQALESQMHQRALSQFKQVALTNARKSAQFLAHNRSQPGVVELPSGVQYAVIKQGKGGATPSVDSKVTVNYRGMLIDGTEFDSTWAHGAPVSFVISGVIPGWRDVIPRMHVGDRWKVVIPPKLAYGERGALPRIGPNEALVFDIELLGIAGR